MNKINKISPDKSEFLQRTLNIAKPPKSLWFMGKIPDAAPAVAIVGSRKPTEYGKYVTHKLASQLAARGVIIVSGLALGHDALAHRGALDGGGTTVALIGAGLDDISPRTNINLAREIVERGGALISEHPPGVKVQRWSFLERNRLVTALSDVIIVVESGARSGTLNTAMHALEQGKELMAVPGNITSPLSVGCNRLIAQGATPVTNADDVFEKLGMVATHDNNMPLAHDPNQQKVVEIIKSGVIEGDKIMATSGMTAAEFNQAITMLEIASVIRSLGANRWVLK